MKATYEGKQLRQVIFPRFLGKDRLQWISMTVTHGGGWCGLL